jgi:hypothetical protein
MKTLSGRDRGDDESDDVRRVRALALLADPEAALDLLTRANSHSLDTTDQDSPAGPQPARPQPAGPQPAADQPSEERSGRLRYRLGRADVYAHLTDTSLAGDDDAAVVRVEDLGPLLKQQIGDWLGHREVTVRPVLNLPAIRPVDCHEVPHRHGEAIRIRTPASAFPYSANQSRNDDNDHTIPYVHTDDGGPPGQTSLDNLSRLGRLEHRIETFAGWTMHQPRSGCFLWRTPHGYWYLVDEHGTSALGRLS